MTQDLPAGDSLWLRLRRHTPARIGLARSGMGIATAAHLAFTAAHAQARGAVHDALDTDSLLLGLMTRGLNPVLLHSAAVDRRSYLLRPDLGRHLSPESQSKLPHVAACDLAIVIADGLSAQAIQRHALPFLDAVTPDLQKHGWHKAPVAVVEQGRVAIADEIGAAFSAALSVVLIGERPGLTSPDSLGGYITWGPRVGRTDAERNCISNIRPDGLGYPHAARTLMYLLTQARARRLTGITLKDETISTALASTPRSGDATA
jgi:ethanolamine ammonia-lyase small subunit